MLSFNPILCQSRATQSLKYFRRRLRERRGGAPCWCSLHLQMSDQVLFPYLQHCCSNLTIFVVIYFLASWWTDECHNYLDYETQQRWRLVFWISSCNCCEVRFEIKPVISFNVIYPVIYILFSRSLWHMTFFCYFMILFQYNIIFFICCCKKEA